MTWKPITEERWDYALGVVPPAFMGNSGFLLGEPFDHHRCSVTGQIRARYAALIRVNGRYFEHDLPLTLAEFKAVKPAEVLAQIAGALG